ncbi:MAG: RnfH family protein [Betaproteobacteria bacterium]|nr:RnfH family protein [Betaproteobacteria bacterium]
MQIWVVAVVAGKAERQLLDLPDGARVGAIENADLHESLRACWQKAAGFAIWGQVVGLDRPLQPGDRVEILQPLQADPKDARRLRVEGLRRAQAEQGRFDRWTRSR